MLTIFTIPKPFKGNINTIQRNAIQSWIRLRPKSEIILFGDEGGAAETAVEFGLKHIPGIKKNEFGSPYLDSAFNLAQKVASNELLVFINADIILMSDFMKAIEKINKLKGSFLMISQRWNLDIKDEIQFDNMDWEQELRNRLLKKGTGPIGTDCFVFPRDFQHNLPSFLVGRDGWDNWFLYQARCLGVPLIDATQIIKAIHQNHDYFHYPEGKKRGKELQNSLKLLSSPSHTFSPKDADWILTEQGLKKRKTFPLFRYCYRFFGSLPAFYPYFSPGRKLLFLPVWLLVKVVKFFKKSA